MESNAKLTTRLMKVLYDSETYRNSLDKKGFYYRFVTDYPKHIIECKNFDKERFFNNFHIYRKKKKIILKFEIYEKKYQGKLIFFEEFSIDQKQVYNIILWFLNREKFPNARNGYWFCEKYGFPDC